MAKLRTQTDDAVFPTFFPITDGIESYTATLDGFDRDKGFLVGATIEFVGTLTSTAIFNDLFGSPFGTFGSATTTVYAGFGSAKGEPDLWTTDMSLIGFGSAFVPPFGTAAAPVNASNYGFGLFTQLDQFKDDQDITIMLDAVGGFSAFPFATLPQGAVVVGAEITYSFVKNRDITNGNSKDNKIKGTDAVDVIRGKSGDDRLSGGKDTDFLLGGSGRDRLFGGNGQDSLDGGAGKDTLYGGAKDDVLSGQQKADSLFGGGGEDVLFGGGGSDLLKGGGKGDLMQGDRGKDTLVGGKGGDALYGGDGKDRLDGGLGTDIYTGGRGADTFVLRDDDPKGAYIKDFGRGDDVIDISDFNVKRKDVSVTFNEAFDEVVLVIDGTVEVVLEDIEVGDVTNEMIIL